MSNKKSRIKLVHITSSLKMGGAEAVLYDLLTHLDAEIFEHHVIYFYDGPYVERIRALGIPTYCVTGFLFRYDIVFFIRLFLLVKKLHPDCIHTLLWVANVSSRLVARLLRIPCVSVLHNNVNQDGRLRAIIDWLTLRYADRLIAVSEEVKQSLLRRNTFIPASRVLVITNGIDAQKMHEQAYVTAKERAALGLTDKDFVIGSVGRFVPVKNYGLLIESFAAVHMQLPQTKLLLLGSGPLEHTLREQVHNFGINNVVHFIIGQHADSYYPLFDCFVMTSSQEGVSIALLEAMSCGIPCIVTNVTEQHSVITSGENGIVVPANNKQILTKTLMNIVPNHVLQDELGYAAQRTVQEQFQVQNMVQAYANVFMQNR